MKKESNEVLSFKKTVVIILSCHAKKTMLAKNEGRREGCLEVWYGHLTTHSLNLGGPNI